MVASQEYWKNRETEAKKHNIQEEAEYNRKIKEIYANMMDEINKEIKPFDRIRVGNKTYGVDFSRKLRTKQIYVVSEVM